MSRPIIYLTNDDGIDSPGLHALVEAVKDFGEIIITAPTNQQTAMGRGITGNINQAFAQKYISIGSKKVLAYHLDTSPAQVVAHALNVFGSIKRPSLFISGINYGENLGTNVTHSGTIGAAIEAADFGIPALAVSLQTHVNNHKKYGDLNWESAIYFTKKFTKIMLQNKMPRDVDIIKIDVPENATSKTEIRFTKVSRQAHYRVNLNNPNYDSQISDGFLQVEPISSETEQNSDRFALLNDGVVSVSPISIDLTSRVNLSDLEKLVNNSD